MKSLGLDGKFLVVSRDPADCPSATILGDVDLSVGYLSVEFHMHPGYIKQFWRKAPCRRTVV